jgi:rhamnose utilization protein RhaD (predicted bifunctional aldolase and dehydrogenase)
LLVAADSAKGIEALSAHVLSVLESRLTRRPDRSVVAVPLSVFVGAASRIEAFAPAGSFVVHRADTDIMGYAATVDAFKPLSSAFSPDHIVYAGHEFLYAAGAGTVDTAWKEYRARNGADPRAAFVSGAGAFAIASSAGAARTAMEFLVDACAVAAYSQSFGGALHMTRERIEFIRTWEVERYRAKTSLGTA